MSALSPHDPARPVPRPAAMSLAQAGHGVEATSAGPRVVVIATERQLMRDVADILPADGEVATYPDVISAQSALAQGPGDVVVIDLAAVPPSALSFLLSAPQLGPHTGVVVVASEGAAQARAALHSGAEFCVLRPYTRSELERVVMRAAEGAAARNELLTLRALVESPADRWLIGRSPVTLRLRDLVVRAAAQRSPVLLTGEPGVGKKHVAQALHMLSNRRQRPFVVVSCSGRSAEALEAALFGTGHDRGALAGVCAGTLVLEAADQLGAPLIARLAQVIALQGTGAGNVPDFRLVATQAERPVTGVVRSIPRYELVGQLRMVPIVVAPLRERRADIPLLVSHLRGRLARELGTVAPMISPEIVSTMMSFDWPGNVRQLEEYVARLFLAPAGARLPLTGAAGADHAEDPLALVNSAAQHHLTMAQLEREYVLRVLDSVDGHRSNAADLLGIDRRTLYRKLKEYQGGGTEPS